MQLALAAARTLHFWAVATLFGGGGLVAALHRRDAPAIRVLRIASVAAAVTGLVWFAIVFVTVTGGDTRAFSSLEAWGDFLSAPFGWPWLIRLALYAAAAGLAVTDATAGFVMVGTTFVIDQAWLGHAANGVGFDGAEQIGFYWLHLLAAFAWVGALTMLCVLTIATRRVPSDALILFSNLGIFVVAAILGSGIVNATLRGVGFDDLLSTPYGQVLTVKLVFFAGMLVFAAFNRVWRWRRGDNETLRISVSLETVLGLSVIGVAAALGVTAPP